MNSPGPTDPQRTSEPSKQPLTCSIAEAAEMIGVSYHTVSRLIKRRKLRTLPGIRHKRIPLIEIQKFLNNL